MNGRTCSGQCSQFHDERSTVRENRCVRAATCNRRDAGDRGPAGTRSNWPRRARRQLAPAATPDLRFCHHPYITHQRGRLERCDCTNAAERGNRLTAAEQRPASWSFADVVHSDSRIRRTRAGAGRGLVPRPRQSRGNLYLRSERCNRAERRNRHIRRGRCDLPNRAERRNHANRCNCP